MEPLVAFSGILIALLAGAISPGPSFVLVARTSMSSSRAAGLAAAMGMGVGGLCFAVLALAGLQAVLAQIPWLYLALKLLGGAYLLYLAFRIWMGARQPLAMSGGDGLPLKRAFGVALATQISNPKTAVVYASIFAALLPSDPPTWLLMALPPAIFLIEAGWYAVVAVVLSGERPRAVYLRSKTAVDRIAGAIMGVLAIRLLSAAAIEE